jgi:hypothetical protein
MSLEDIATAMTFVVVGFTMLITHNVADHWVQTDCQARDKGLVGEDMTKGRLACLRHVLSYTTCTAVLTSAVWSIFSLQITWVSFLAGQMISAITHYWADRRHTLAKLAEMLPVRGFYGLGKPRKGLIDPDDPSKGEYNDNPTIGTGAYALDQAWHWWWIFIASLVTAVAA